jgi:hypothetical protein
VCIEESCAVEVPGVKRAVEGRLPIGLQVANLPHKKN